MKLNSISLTFDDVLLIPKYSEIESRKDVKLDFNIKNYSFNNPIIPANMKDIISLDLLKFCYENKMLGLLHRFESIEEQILKIKELSLLNNIFNYIGVSVGVKDSDKENINKFLDLGIKIFCIDVAHGDHKLVYNVISYLRKLNGNILIISGNVATYDATKRMMGAGSDIIKVGIGPGSICSTRTQTGAGGGQFSVLKDIRARCPKAHLIADGGMTKPGDAVKALCFADFIMSGYFFAGTSLAAGQKIKTENGIFMRYDGSSTYKNDNIEGVKSIVPIKSETYIMLKNLLDGIKSGCSYQGAASLKDLRKNPSFIRISNAVLKESSSHDVQIIS